MSEDITAAPKVSPGSPSQDYTEDNIRPIAGLLGLDVHAVADADGNALQKIYDYVRGDNAEMTELELLSKIRGLEQRLGLASLGERRVDKIYRYVKLQSQIESLERVRDRELR